MIICTLKTTKTVFNKSSMPIFLVHHCNTSTANVTYVHKYNILRGTHITHTHTTHNIIIFQQICITQWVYRLETCAWSWVKIEKIESTKFKPSKKKKEEFNLQESGRRTQHIYFILSATQTSALSFFCFKLPHTRIYLYVYTIVY